MLFRLLLNLHNAIFAFILYPARIFWRNLIIILLRG